MEHTGIFAIDATVVLGSTRSTACTSGIRQDPLVDDTRTARTRTSAPDGPTGSTKTKSSPESTVIRMWSERSADAFFAWKLSDRLPRATPYEHH